MGGEGVLWGGRCGDTEVGVHVSNCREGKGREGIILKRQNGRVQIISGQWPSVNSVIWEPAFIIQLDVQGSLERAGNWAGGVVEVSEVRRV